MEVLLQMAKRLRVSRPLSSFKSKKGQKRGRNKDQQKPLKFDPGYIKSHLAPNTPKRPFWLCKNHTSWKQTNSFFIMIIISKNMQKKYGWIRHLVQYFSMFLYQNVTEGVINRGPMWKLFFQVIRPLMATFASTICPPFSFFLVFFTTFCESLWAHFAAILD